MKTSATPSSAKLPRRWGMAGVFHGALGVYNEGDPWRNKLAFIAKRGFHEAGCNIGDLEEPERRAFLEQLHERYGLGYFVHYKPDVRKDAAEERDRLLAEAKMHIAARSTLALPIAQVVVPGALSRFQRDLPLAEQLDRLATVLEPFVAELGGAGLTVAIENHADYYVSDLVGLCKRVPGLTILLDTGNCFLVGERPDLIPDAAYPLVSCTHFKDHFVQPVPKELHFQLRGATLGAGDVGLEAMYRRLLALHPDPASVHLMIEWVPDPGKDAVVCFNESLAFLQRISGGNFTPQPFHPEA
ncbi:MAG: sugar phosphate isomerase/epimerase family protein [Opitutales bacterium]